MAMVKILCDLNDREKAFKTLANISDSFLLSWSKANPQFLLSRDSSLTLLGQVSLISNKISIVCLAMQKIYVKICNFFCWN